MRGGKCEFPKLSSVMKITKNAKDNVVISAQHPISRSNDCGVTNAHLTVTLICRGEVIKHTTATSAEF